MPLLFVDSFNHSDFLTNQGGGNGGKWDFGFQGRIAAGVARTGTQCCQVFNGSSGPAKNLGPQQMATNYDHLIQGVALNFDGLTANSDVMYFSVVAPSVDSPNIKAVVNTDGSISIFRGAGDTGAALLGTSVSKPFVFTGDTTQWNYLEVKWKGDAVDGFVEVRFSPPGGPMAVILTITGVKTVAFADAPVCNQVQILAAAGLAHLCYFADYYCLDWSNPLLPHSDYLGGVKIYHDMPFANGAVQWLALAGSNWQEVDEVPPDGDTSYNASSTVGQIDQYLHNVTGIPANAQVKAVQHIMDVRLTDGARAITSVAGGVAHPNSVYIGNNYGMFTYMYDQNPASLEDWSQSDFPFAFGPGVTF